jgi:hypothetical protein
MKTQILVLSTIMIVSSSFVGLSSSSPVSEAKTITKTQTTDFAFFRTHRQGRGITSTWGLSSNTGVSEFVVRKTYEDPNDEYAEWQTVYSSPCSASRSFKCTDNNVTPGFISYQVVALMTDGSTIASAIVTEHVVSH